MKLLPHETRMVANVVRTTCGVVLDQTKDYLIESRLGPLATSAGCESYTELCSRAMSGSEPELLSAFIDVITTHETSFFRDVAAFEAIEKEVLPALLRKAKERGHRRIRVWSLACSTGQEAYSIAFMLLDLMSDVSGWDISIRGSDISQSVVEHARRGIYSKPEVERSSRPGISKYLIPDGACYSISDDVRAITEFDVVNLLSTESLSPGWDLVLCRNVAIYFDPDARVGLFRRIAAALKPDGFLISGCSESLSDLGYAPVMCGNAYYYQPNLLNEHSC